VKKWVRERDLLITQTMAFVQSITGKKPETDARPEARINSEAHIEFAPIEEIEAVERPVEIIPPPARPPSTRPSPAPHSEIREEIQRRVAAFRAHQQLFEREREAYFNAVLAKARASTGNPLKQQGN
jgi:hypothetical protein